MSSPARSSASATSVGAQGGGGGAGSSSTAGFGDDASTCHFPRDLVTPQEHKDEALAVLKTELMAALDKEVKSLDKDSWMFAGHRSQIHLISRPETPESDEQLEGDSEHDSSRAKIVSPLMQVIAAPCIRSSPGT